jgi:hypothetical protein
VKKLKLGLFLFIFLLGLSNSAIAAIRVTPTSPNFTIPYISKGDQVAAGLLSGSSLIVTSTIENPASGISNAYIATYGLDGGKNWEVSIPIESVAGPVAKDNLGNIYVLGASVSTNDSSAPIPTNDSSALNPDNVQTEPVVTPKNILTNLTVWKISNSGALQQTFVLPINEVVFPSSISTTANGFILAANTSKQYFQVPIDLTGTFGTITYPKQPKAKDLTQEIKLASGKLKFFISSKSIIGIPTWKPKKPIPVLIQYSKFGQIKVANYFQGTPNFIIFQPSAGAIIGTELTSGFGVTIVKPLK